MSKPLGLEPARRLQKVMAILGPLYPAHIPMLRYKNPFQLLAATLLAAQCTDAAVNLVTPALFRRFPNPASLAEAPVAELETLIHSTGFFHAKARNLKAMGAMLRDGHGGKVPGTMEELTALPGVGRKTASVVLSTFFDTPAIIVDTHFSRVSRRLGFTESDKPPRIERDIAAIAPREQWIAVSDAFNQHGRDICHARKPECERCPVRELCAVI